MPTLTYELLKAKARREIARLEMAEQSQQEHEGQDAALNAAFSLFHLLEWKDKDANPASQAGARSLARGNPYFEILHDIVTHTKHVTVSRPLSGVTLDVHTSAGFTQTPVVFDDIAVVASGGVVVVEEPRLFVKFGTDRALDILRKAEAYFN